MSFCKGNTWVIAVALPCVAGLSVAPAHAQQASLEEVVVTAQKREQRLSEVPISVSSIGAEGLEALGRQDVSMLAAQVPSLQVLQYNPTVTVFNLRGVSQNDFADSQEAPIAFYSDEVYIASLGAISGMTFDLDRIEVLRGPQGTLFGRNATGGLVHAVSARPTREFSAFATVTAGEHGQISTEAAVSGPLSDVFRGRLSLTSNRNDGYLKNSAGRNLGATDLLGGRLQLEADIGGSGKIALKVHGLRNDDIGGGGLYSHVAVVPDADGLGRRLLAGEDAFETCVQCDAFGFRDADGDPLTGSWDRIGFFKRKYWGSALRYEREGERASLMSITDYQHLRKRYGEDSDMSPATVFDYDTEQTFWQISQEIRLSGKAERSTWLAGVYGLSIDSQNDYVADLSQSIDLIAAYGGTLKTRSWAVFAQADYQLATDLTVTAGVRYSADRKTYDYATALNGVNDFRFNTGSYPDLARREFNDVSGRLAVDYKPSDDLMLYASISRGTKGGGFGTPGFAPSDPSTIPFDAEILTSVEAGAKWAVLEGKMDVSAAAFHYNYDAYQAFSVIGFSQFITNNAARVDGLELEVRARPSESISLVAFASVLDGGVDGIVTPAGSVLDRRLPQAPRVSVGFNGSYRFIVRSGAVKIQTDWKYDSMQFLSAFNAPIDREKERVVGNARLSFVTTDEKFEVAVFVNNLTDRRYRLYNLDQSTVLGNAQQVFARPRWFGVSLSTRLN